MTIRDMKKFIKSLPDWSMLDGCWGSGTGSPTDIDGCVERAGKCLFLEHKQPGVWLDKPQVWTFEALAMQGNTGIFYWGEKPDVTRIRIQLPGTRQHQMINNATLADLREVASDWWNVQTRTMK